MAAPLEELKRAISDSGLVPPVSSGVVLVSGGPDSACAAAGLTSLLGPEGLVALCLNYGLRDTADRDERAARSICERLGIELVVERPTLAAGNLQAAAREARYAAAERLRAGRGLDWIATGHSRTDQVETVIYRLAVSPGRRGLLGLGPRRGRVIRPLLSLERDQLRAIATELELPFEDDETNEDRHFARAKVRADALPALLELSPEAERNISETRAELEEEAALLDRVVNEALDAAGVGRDASAIDSDSLQRMEPALRRLVLRTLAERTAVREVAIGRWRTEEIVRLAAESEGGAVDLGGGLRAVCEQGFVSFIQGTEEEPPAPVALPVPGNCRFGRWELTAELRPGPIAPEGPERATLDGHVLGRELLVRAWHEGDRMRPLGLDGSKSLQDLFTDRRVPRSLRRALPVVTVRGKIAWVAGVAVADEFKLTPDSSEVAILSARLAGWRGTLPR